MRQRFLERWTIIHLHGLVYLHTDISLIEIVDTILELVKFLSAFEVLSTISHN